MKTPNVGEILQAHRVARGWSIREAGRHAGLDHGTIYRLETRDYDSLPSLKALSSYAETLGLKIVVSIAAATTGEAAS